MNKKHIVVSIQGPTNVGKSSLINCFVGKKISIVTHKVQTTRSAIRGIVNRGDVQLIFVDTPGIFLPKNALEKMIVKTAWRSLLSCEMSMLVIDSKKGISKNVKNIIKNIETSAIAVLNKVDLVDKRNLLSLANEIYELFQFDKIFMVSALKNDGVDDIISYLTQKAANENWLYSEKQATDAPLKFILSEITREKLFLRIHKEVPYKLLVETEKVKEAGNHEIMVFQAIYVYTQNHKKIITGKNGSTLKHIEQLVCEEIYCSLKRKAILRLFIKVRKNWIGNERIFSHLYY